MSTAYFCCMLLLCGEKCNKKSVFCVELFHLKIDHEINILSVVLKFCARVDTYFLYNETLIDYASELKIRFLLEGKNINLFTVTTER